MNQRNKPYVSVIISARNEESVIAGRIENLIKQTYKPKNIEIIVVSDGSTDKTSELVQQIIDEKYGKQVVKLITFPESKGKPNALNTAINIALGEVILFTDSRQRFESNAIEELVANFADPSVGGVSGELLFLQNSESEIIVEMGSYWAYEKWIRKTESSIHSVVGATGAIYAIRRSLYIPIPCETLIDDVLIPMNVVLQGYRVLFDNAAKAYDLASMDMEMEKRRKIRTLLGNYQILKLRPAILLPLKNPICIRYISHKIFRLFVPLFMIFLVISGIAVGSIINLVVVSIVFGMIFLALMNKRIQNIKYIGKIAKLSNAIISLNYFAFLAFLYLFRFKRGRIW